MPCIVLHAECQRRGKRSTCTLILEMWHDVIILTTVSLYLFNHGVVSESFILFKSEKLKVRA